MFWYIECEAVISQNDYRYLVDKGMESLQIISRQQPREEVKKWLTLLLLIISTIVRWFVETVNDAWYKFNLSGVQFVERWKGAVSGWFFSHGCQVLLGTQGIVQFSLVYGEVVIPSPPPDLVDYQNGSVIFIILRWKCLKL